MKFFNLSKRNIIITVCISVLIIGALGALIWNGFKNDKLLKNFETTISTQKNLFADTADRNIKLNSINILVAEHSLSKTKLNNKELDTKFTNEIEAMKKYFINDYNTIIAENTLNLDEITETGVISPVIKNLDATLIKIKSESDIVSTVEIITKYEADIKTLTTSYQAKITALENEARIKAEEQAKIKAEEEKQAKAKEASKIKAEKDKQAKAKEVEETTKKSTSKPKQPSYRPWEANGSWTTGSHRGRKTYRDNVTKIVYYEDGTEVFHYIADPVLKPKEEFIK